MKKGVRRAKGAQTGEFCRVFIGKETVKEETIQFQKWRDNERKSCVMDAYSHKRSTGFRHLLSSVGGEIGLSLRT